MENDFIFDLRYPFNLNDKLYGLYELGAYQACEEITLKILAKYPDNLMAECILGLAQLKMGKFAEAEQHLTKGLTLKQNRYTLNAFFELTQSRIAKNDLKNAEESCQELIGQYTNNLADLYFNKGRILTKKLDYLAAITAYKFSVSLHPTIHAYRNLISLLKYCDKSQETLNISKQAVLAFPDSEEILCEHADLLKHCCAWDDYAIYNALAIKLVSKGLQESKSMSIDPLYAVTSGFDAKTCLEIAKKNCQQNINQFKIFTHPLSEKLDSSTIKIGYVSRGLCDHPTGKMMAHFFQFSHEKFPSYIYSLVSDAQDQYSMAIKKSCKQFLDVSKKDSYEIAQQIYNDKIDILIDLDGYIANNQLEIFSYRPAPIQISYLGFPGTTGADFIDYLIADKIIIPEEQQQYYSEKIIYMPYCYQVNDSEQEVITKSKYRKSYNLPEKKFIFACFNTTYKIDYETFKSWMRILKAVPNSILWLIDCHEIAKKNIISHAKKLNVNPGRIHFSPYLSKAEHLTRLKVADLYLDTFTCNAHSSAADALWSNIPIVTMQGANFASRVCSSLLYYVGLGNLVTQTAEEYEKVAIDLANHPKELKKYKKQLNETILQTLFNTKLFMKNLEKAYDMVWQRYVEGKKPESIEI